VASKWVPLGPGTLTLGTAPKDFSGECLGASVKHTYTDVGDNRIMLDGTARAASKVRVDGFKCKVENDLTANGLYQFLQTNDLTDQAITYTPNTAGAAKWAGTVKVQLPDEIGADEFGKPIISEPEWDASGGTGKFTFTPGT
jgi:hypothetical protein